MMAAVARHRRGRDLRSLDLRRRAPLRAVGRGSHRCWPARPPGCSAQWGWRVTPPTTGVQLAAAWRASGCGSCGRRGCWRCGRCGAGASHLSRRHVAIPLSALVDGAGGLHGDGRFGPRADARPAGRRGAGRLRAAHAEPQHQLRRSTGSRSSSSRCWRIAMWVIYVAMQTGVPAKPAANVLKLAPGFRARFSWLPLIVAIAGQRRLAVAGALAHRAPPRRAVEAAWCCRPAAWRWLAAADDAVAAAPGLRPQLPRSRRAAVEAHPTRRVHQPRPDCRAR